ncbi:MAG: cyclic pyranopterin monophosphate synthase MoaC [bacterium]
MGRLSHSDNSGRARMVDVGGKEITRRSATARVSVHLNDEAFAALTENRSTKGDVMAVAKIAGIQAAKKTSELIPLCHPVALDQIDLEFVLDREQSTVTIKSTARCSSRTGVEMEVLTACSVAALTVYDMLKAIQRDITITDLVLLEKKGGKSGDFLKSDP